MRLKDILMPKIAELIYYGLWFSPEFQSLKELIEKTQEKVTGVVRLKLYKGNVIVAGRKSPYSLYHKSLASFEEAGGYNHKDAEGFIRLQALRLRTYNILQGGGV
jgi:argininosuccinate synthase